MGNYQLYYLSQQAIKEQTKSIIKGVITDKAPPPRRRSNSQNTNETMRKTLTAFVKDNNEHGFEQKEIQIVDDLRFPPRLNLSEEMARMLQHAS